MLWEVSLCEIKCVVAILWYVLICNALLCFMYTIQIVSALQPGHLNLSRKPLHRCRLVIFRNSFHDLDSKTLAVMTNICTWGHKFNVWKAPHPDGTECMVLCCLFPLICTCLQVPLVNNVVPLSCTEKGRCNSCRWLR